MSDRRKFLQMRRAELLQRSSKQRARLSRSLRSLDARLHTADDRIAAVQRYVVSPLLAVLAVAALLLLRRRPGITPLLRAGVLLSAGLRAAGAIDRQRRRLGKKAAIDGKAF